MADYQTAQALVRQAQDIFNNELRFLAYRDATNSIAKLEDGLEWLNKSIENKSSPIESYANRTFTSSSIFAGSIQSQMQTKM